MGAEGARLRRRLCRRVVEGEKVQKVQRVQRVQRGRYRRFAAMSFIIPLRGMENRTTGLRPWKTSKPPCGRWKCTPFGTFGTTFPPEGELLAVLCIEVLMSSEAERRTNFPLRGKSPQGNRGAFPSGEARLYGFLAHRYLSANESLSPCAEILRFAQNGRVRRKGKWRYSSAADRRHIYSSPVGRYHNPQPRSGCQSLAPSEPSARRAVNLSP